MRVRSILEISVRIGHAARTLLTTVRYFAGLMPAPKWLYVELVNTCNADCIFCAYRYDKREKTTLGGDVVSKVVGEFKKLGGKRVGLSPTLGETFVDRGAVEKIRNIDKLGFESIHTYTNASLLHRPGVENVLRSGLTAIYLSMPPLEKNLYRKIYQNGNYSKVLKNVHDLLIAFARMPDKTVKNIYLDFRSDRPVGECMALPDFKTHIGPHLGPNVHVRAMTRFDSWSGAIKEEDLLPGMTLLDGVKEAGPKRIPCGRIFTLQVLSNGAIRQCGCRVDTTAEKDELVLGHIDDMTLKEAFRSKRARDNVASFINGKHLDVCHKCSWYSPSI